MRIDRRTLKQAAREQIANTRPRAPAVTLMYLLISFGVSAVGTVVSVLAGGISLYTLSHFNGGAILMWFFINVLIWLFSMVLSFGYTAYSLRVVDGEEAGYRDLFSGFPETGRVLLMNLALMGFYLVWMLAVILPGATILSFLMLPIMLLGQEVGVTVLVVLVIVFYVAVLVVLMLVMVRYTLSAYILADDPTIRPLEAIRRSRALLRGHNKECLLLQLSFIGWILLAVLIAFVVLAVGMTGAAFAGSDLGYVITALVAVLAMMPLMVWLQPYISVTIGKYYRLLSPRADEQTDQPAQLPTPETPWRAGE